MTEPVSEQTIRAIIVDDEYNARKILPVLIDWSALGWEFVGEASNGPDALDLVDTVRPDVIFADINMPYMNGLELSRLVRQRDPFIKIVIITAYPEFEYAQESVKLGVSDFLLKPLHTETVAALAQELRTQVLETSAHWKEHREMKDQLAESKRFLQEQFLNELVVASGDEGQLARRWEYFFGAASGQWSALAVLEVASSLGLSVEDRLLRGLQCRRFVESFLQDRPDILVFRDLDGHLVLLGWSTSDLSEVGDRLIRSLHERLGLAASVGIGGTITDLSRVRVSYREALEALRYEKLTGGGHVTTFGEDIRLQKGPWEFPQERIEEIVFLIKTGIESQASIEMVRLFSDLSETHGMVVEQAYAVAVQLVSLSLNALADVGIALPPEDWGNAVVLGRILQCSSIGELQILLGHLAEEASALIRKTRVTKTRTMIEEVKSYILKEFTNPELSLTSVATRFQCNSSYLSRIFKQETGASFSEYLVRQRIEEAARLMVETDLKAYQIGEQVGIRDPYYFSNCFKKVLGISVQEYRRTLA